MENLERRVNLADNSLIHLKKKGIRNKYGMRAKLICKTEFSNLFEKSHVYL